MTIVDRGISWQGPTPHHWSAGPIRRFLSPRKDLVGEQWSSTQLLSLTKAGIIRRDPESGEGKFPASFEGYQLVEAGDLVLCLFDVDETPRTVGVAHEAGMITSAYSRFKVNTAVADTSFVEWAFIAIDDSKRFRPLYTGLRKVIQRPRLLGAQFALPPLAEQRAIADFLDRETGKIDALLEKQTELISGLRERRAVMISRAVVSAGSCAGGDTGQSRLDHQLATLPQGWERVRLSRLVSVPVSAGVDYSAEPYDPETHLRYLRTTDLVGLRQLLPSDSAVGVSADQAGTALVLPGDILLTRSGSLGTSYLHETDEVMAYAGYLVRARVRSDWCDRRFFAWWSRSKDHLDQIALGATKSTIDNFSASKFSAMRVPVPPIGEQREIADYLDEETAKIDKLIDKTKRMIGLSRERRSALITAAVTGQIDVNEHGGVA